MSAVRDCLFNLFAATIYIGSRSPIRNLRTRHAMVTGTHYIRKLRVFENMVLRRIFGPRRDEVTGEWRRLHKEELNDLHSSPNIVRVIISRNEMG